MDWKRNKTGGLIVDRQALDQARKYLHRNAGFDFDTFWRKATVESLIEAPLGSSSECLSVEEIANLNSGDLHPTANERFDAIRAHLPSCAECQGNLTLYREIEAGAGAKRDQFVLAPVAQLRRDGREVSVDFALLYGNTAAPHPAIATETVELSGRWSVHGCAVESAVALNDSNVHAIRTTFRGAPLEAFPISDTEVCDWVEIKGSTKSGETFKARSFVCFKPESAVRQQSPALIPELLIKCFGVRFPYE